MYSNRVMSTNAIFHSTYKLISSRLNEIGIPIEKYIKRDDKGIPLDLRVYESTLDGISFITKDRFGQFDIELALASALKNGKPAFIKNNDPNASHWGINLSMMATQGTGYREIKHFKLNDSKDLLLKNHQAINKPKLDIAFSANFGQTQARLDISSLHFAVYGDLVKIHIDQAGFVMDIPNGNNPFLTPDLFMHTLDELLAKDITGIPENIQIFLPNSKNHFTRFGIRATKSITPRLRMKVEQSCSVRGKGCSLTMSADGIF